jgi:hypothetical protein
LIHVPTITPCAAVSVARAVSSVVPEPTRTGASGTARRTASTSPNEVPLPVPAPETIRASARRRELRMRHAAERDRRTGERRVLDQHVGPDRDVLGAERAAQGERLGGLALDHALVGDHRAGVHVDAHEREPACRGDPERGTDVVAQHVDAERELRGAPDLGAGGGERRHDLRRDRGEAERRVAEVLDDRPVQAAGFERGSVGERAVDRAAHRVFGARGRARGAGQGSEVDDADQALSGEKPVVCHGGAD